MKLGVVCEGEKTDGPVLEVLLRACLPGRTIKIAATTKQAIFSSGGVFVDALLAEGCSRVIVAWDLHPIGTQMKVNSQTHHSEPCQTDQRNTLLNAIERSGGVCRADAQALKHRYGIDGGLPGNPRVELVCFCASFDAIFLYDLPFLRQVASSNIRKAAPPPSIKHPTAEKFPAERLRSYFRTSPNNRFKFFNKHQHNLVLAQLFVENKKLDRLLKHPGFNRLVDLLGA
jgi:hypothetical protein